MSQTEKTTPQDLTTLTPPQDLTTLTPPQVDKLLAKAHMDANTALTSYCYSMNEMHRFAGDKSQGHGSQKTWGMSDEEAERVVRESGRGQYALERMQSYRDQVREFRAEIKRLDAEFTRRGGWSRFFLVQNAGGHIHSSMDCSTCNKFTSRGQGVTQFGWLPSLSGQTEREAVDAHGAILCTVCFPSAPVEWTNAHEVAKAARAAAQCPGSGTFLDRSKPHRTGYHSGNWGTCPECSAMPAVTKGGKLRAHKPE